MAVRIEARVLPEDVERGLPTGGACPVVLAAKRALDEAGVPGLHAIVLPAKRGPMGESRYYLEVAFWAREREVLARQTLPDDLSRALSEFDAAHRDDSACGSERQWLRDAALLPDRWPSFEFNLELSEAAMAQLCRENGDHADAGTDQGAGGAGAEFHDGVVFRSTYGCLSLSGGVESPN